MEIVVNDGSGDNHWSRDWAEAFAAALPEATRPARVEVNVSGRSQMSLKVRHHGMATVCMINCDRTVEPARRAGQYADWFLGEPQQAKFAEVRQAESARIRVERAAVLAAAMKVDGDTFQRGVRQAVTGSVARCKGGKPHVAIGVETLAIAPGLTVRTRKDDIPALRLRASAFRLTNLSFTPQVDMHLPGAVIEAMTGEPLERFVDHPMIKGAGLVVDHVTCAGGGDQHSRARTSIHLVSDPIGLDEAAALVDAMRIGREEA